MAITVKHKFVSTIPDGDDASVVRPSNWNDTHELTGLGTMAEQDASSVAITGGTITGTSVSGYIPTSAEGVANGVATLDSNGQVPLSQIPALGDLNYQGTWNASTNSPTLTSSVGTKGFYYVVSVAGTTNLNGITDWQVGDWAVYSGTAWQKIDNTDAVTSVNGQTGAVTITLTSLGAGTIATQNANSVAITGGSINGTTIGASAQADITGNTISAYTKFVAQDYYAQSVLGGNLRTSGGTSLLNWDGGGSGNISVNGGLTANPANKNISLSPTGTGTVTINPSTTGAMDNVVIGATTPKAITGTTITGTSFVGSGASLTNVVNSLTASTGISVSGSTGAVTVTNTAPDQVVALTAGTGISVSGTYPNFTVTNTQPSSGGTVTSVTGTAPISSSGGNTPAISISQATTSTNGYLSSTDWNTFNNKQPAGSYLTTVTADAPLTGSGTSASHLSIPAATSSVNGYLTSTDWTTFNNKATYPTQTGNSGKFLTTNGSATSWATLPTVLPVLNHSGSTVSVAVGNGLLPVLSHSGSTINVAVQ